MARQGSGETRRGRGEARWDSLPMYNKGSTKLAKSLWTHFADFLTVSSGKKKKKKDSVQPLSNKLCSFQRANLMFAFSTNKY